MNKTSKTKSTLISIGFCYMGLSFTHMALNPEVAPLFSDIFIIVVAAMSFGIFVYGFLCLIANFRTSKDVQEFKDEIQTNINNALTKKNNGRK